MARKRLDLIKAFGLALFLFAAAISVDASWRTVGNISSVIKKTNEVILTTTSGAKVSVSFLSPDSVRIRMSAKGAFEPDQSYAVDYSRERHFGSFTVRETALSVEIANAVGARVVIKKQDCLVSIFDASGALVAEDDPARPMSFDNTTGSIEVGKRRDGAEFYYGFGEKSLPMSRHMQSMAMWNTDTYGYTPATDPIYETIPFFITLRDGKAYGTFFNNTYRSWFDMGKQDPSRYVFGANGGELDYYVFTGGRERFAANILRDYTELTGRSPLPPIWALGNQQSRWSYESESKVREIANKFRETKIPADVIYLDIDYMDGYRLFTWNKERFPDPQKMLGDLSAQGFHTVLIIDPGVKVDENYAVYRQGVEKSLFIKDPKGKDIHGLVWPGECAFPDFTNPKAREWFSSLYKGFIEQGVAGFWNDMNEPAIFMPADAKGPEFSYHPARTFQLDGQHAGDGLAGDHARYHNVYGMQMARSTFEGQRKLRPEKRPFVLTRAGFAGIQRYSAVWTGDNVASWEHLAMTIPMLTNLGISGVPFVGADVGGFVGSPSAELYARWLEAASLTPFFRSHTEKGSADQEPFAYGPEFIKINRSTVELRYRLLPYLYTLFYQQERDGLPIMRPLWFAYQGDHRTWLIDDEYLVGPDLLVAPVVREGQPRRGVYFPAGDDWVDWNTGKLYKGGSSASIEAPIERLPLFARVGSVIPTQPVVQNTGEMKNVPVTLTVVGGIADGKTEKSTLFQDAGDGYDYRGTANWRVVSIEHKRGSIKLERTGYPGRFQPVKFIEVINFASDPKQVLIDGIASSSYKYEPAAQRLAIELPNDNVREITVAR